MKTNKRNELKRKVAMALACVLATNFTVLAMPVTSHAYDDADAGSYYVNSTDTAQTITDEDLEYNLDEDVSVELPVQDDYENETDTVEITTSVVQKYPVDITLAVGDSDLDVSQFEKDLQAKLEEMGIVVNVNEMNVETKSILLVDSNGSEARNIFDNWGRIGYTGQWSFNTTYQSQSNVIVNAENTDNLTGFYDPNSMDATDVTFGYTNGTFNSDNDGMGAFIRFNLEASGAVTTYLFILHGDGGHWPTTMPGGLYKISNKGFTYGNAVQLVATSNIWWTRNSWANYKLEAEGDTIKVYQNNKLIISYTDPNPIMSGSYGFFSISQPAAAYRDITVYENRKAFKDVLYDATWSDDSTRVIINLDETTNPEFSDEDTLSEILSKTQNEDIHYIGWGSSATEDQNSGFVEINDDKGLTTSTSDYDKALQEMAEYIANLVAESQVNKNDYANVILVGSITDIDVDPSELKEDTTSDEWPNGAWRIDHTPTYFENSYTLATFSGVYTDDLEVDFSLPGMYKIYYQDVLVSTYYAHRRPVADFNATVSGTNVSVTNTSYDLDLSNGLVSYEWSYKETTATEWISGQPSNLEADTNYIIKLVVTDNYGVESLPATKYITTKSVSTTPVAQFTVPSVVSKYEELNVVDTSYSPSGADLDEYVWTLTKDGRIVATYSKDNLPTDLDVSPYGEGDYNLSLKVSSGGVWSEVYSRAFTVIKDLIAPDVSYDVTGGYYNEDIYINVDITDRGGSLYKDFKYALTSTTSTPASSAYSSLSTDAEQELVITEDGYYYVHLCARDNELNTTNKVLGPFILDTVAPTAEHTLSNEEDTTGSVDILLNFADELSGFASVQLPNGQIVTADEVEYTVYVSGVYKFTVTDKSGNVYVHEVKVDNIVNPAGKYEIRIDDEISDDLNNKAEEAFDDYFVANVGIYSGNVLQDEISYKMDATVTLPTNIVAGTVQVFQEDPKTGELVELTTTPNERGEYIKVTGDTVTIVTNRSDTFLVTYEKLGVTVNQTPNGTTSVDTTTPNTGDTVTITPTPDNGYIVDQVTVTDKDGNPLDVTVNPDGTLSFVKPDGEVNVEVTYTKEPSVGDVVVRDEHGSLVTVVPGGTGEDIIVKDKYGNVVGVYPNTGDLSDIILPGTHLNDGETLTGYDIYTDNDGNLVIKPSVAGMIGTGQDIPVYDEDGHIVGLIPGGTGGDIIITDGDGNILDVIPNTESLDFVQLPGITLKPGEVIEGWVTETDGEGNITLKPVITQGTEGKYDDVYIYDKEGNLVDVVPGGTGGDIVVKDEKGNIVATYPNTGDLSNIILPGLNLEEGLELKGWETTEDSKGNIIVKPVVGKDEAHKDDVLVKDKDGNIVGLIPGGTGGDIIILGPDGEPVIVYPNDGTLDDLILPTLDLGPGLEVEDWFITTDSDGNIIIKPIIIATTMSESDLNGDAEDENEGDINPDLDTEDPDTAISAIPQTNDSATYVIWFVMLLISGAFMFMINRKKI